MLLVGFSLLTVSVRVHLYVSMYFHILCISQLWPSYFEKVTTY